KKVRVDTPASAAMAATVVQSSPSSSTRVIADSWRALRVCRAFFERRDSSTGMRLFCTRCKFSSTANMQSCTISLCAGFRSAEIPLPDSSHEHLQPGSMLLEGLQLAEQSGLSVPVARVLSLQPRVQLLRDAFEVVVEQTGDDAAGEAVDVSAFDDRQRCHEQLCDIGLEVLIAGGEDPFGPFRLLGSGRSQPPGLSDGLLDPAVAGVFEG